MRGVCWDGPAATLECDGALCARGGVHGVWEIDGSRAFRVHSGPGEAADAREERCTT